MNDFDHGSRKRALLTSSSPAHGAGISEAVVIKDSEIFFLSRQDGSVPIGDGHGLGLYHRDCRFLSGYELELGGKPLEGLAYSAADGFRSVIELTNPEIDLDGDCIGRQELTVRWRHVIDIGDGAMRDEIVVRNYNKREHTIPLTLSFAADFADIFTIRGLVDDRPGRCHPVRWQGDELRFSYDGADDIQRHLLVRFSKPPARVEDDRATFELRLAPQEAYRLVVSFLIVEHPRGERPRVRPQHDDVAEADEAFERSIDLWMQGFASVQSNSPWLDRVLSRSMRDLGSLRMSLGGHSFFAAGVPWFATLFGRDSALCALQTLAYRPEIAADTLRLLAHFQSQEVDPWRDAEPGKILHELRVGELARLGAIPHTPYYGSVDATPLFLILLGEHARWTGSLELFHELRPSVMAALSWMSSFGDSDGDGYIDYRSRRDGGNLVNQGWKDAGDSIVNARGECAEPPIALIEVQAYAYRAQLEIAELFARAGERARAHELRGSAQQLAARINHDFWLEDRGFFALGLHRPRREPLDVISSNPGHALWAEVVDGGRARSVVSRLMADDMYSGWGVRTLSSNERGYNPIGYHLGTVWPHENALIAAGFRRYGFDAAACRIFEDLIDAAMRFEHHRLPEVFAGHARGDYGVPVRFPVACHPQAWAAGSMPYLLQELLGLRPEAFEHRLRIVRPCLPAFVHELSLQGLRVGQADVDLMFERISGHRIAVRVVRRHGDLDIAVDEA